MKLASIRIKGEIGLRHDTNSTLDRLRLRRKYSCIVLENPSEVQMGMIEKVRDCVAFGEITEDTYKKLVEARGKKDKDGKLKPFFRLHPAQGGMDTKLHFGVKKGVLGDNKEMDKLIGRML
jgi:large subunit ribosomal protein L30